MGHAKRGRWQAVGPRYVRCPLCGYRSCRAVGEDGTYGRCSKHGQDAPLLVPVGDRRKIKTEEIARQLRGE